MNHIIKEITSHETLPIRHKVMWPDKPLEYVKVPNDNEGRHFGLFIDKKLISIISLFEEKKEVQFRKFATLDVFQGKGYGSQLLRFIIDLIEKEGVRKVWCNARVDKAGYYRKFGLNEIDKRYEKGGIQFVIMEK
ncbi:GNAT family N-acetyltransferase [Aquimarina sp. W85]|uniref:GNAT family N-acetyltransferase n=1 Tax=Aquimarina rhodophyticola TaxID=3342246 RepID=UPI003671D32E